ncbi:MAG: UvrD-helicase domain-containing protein [Planctomycetes bacterium]|nr:UvrD-helicase domain-containing protein [Planctomycetota bacterium]
MKDILADLTSAQREAVTYGAGPLLIVAGPGSGKTRVVTRRIAYLLSQGVKPWQITAVTFTNKAAGEMLSRVEAIVGKTNMWISTFHSLCAKILRMYGNAIGYPSSYTIYDEEDSKKIVSQCAEELGSKAGKKNMSQLRSLISTSKNKDIEIEALAFHDRTFKADFLREVYTLYQQRLREAFAMDFDDLLLNTRELFVRHPKVLEEFHGRFNWLLVDEYQDTNSCQYQISRILASKTRNFSATGDPDQSIYAWRGAEMKNVFKFLKDYESAKTVYLEDNFRSTKSILQVADCVIRYNENRIDKKLVTSNPEGEKPVLLVCYGADEEAEWIAERIAAHVEAGGIYRDFAVLYRTSAQSRSIENALKRAVIPYTIIGGLAFFQRREIKDIVAYLRLIDNPMDIVSFLRATSVPPRGLGEKTIHRLHAFARSAGVSMIEAMAHAEEVPGVGRTIAKKIEKFRSELLAYAGVKKFPVAPLVSNIVETSGYKKWMRENDEDWIDREDNLAELHAFALEYDMSHPEDGSLTDFLANVALLSSLDMSDDSADRALLMTLHAAKGLEFPCVVICGLEEGQLPHARSINSLGEIEEERRLFYVGVTRAKKTLALTCALGRTSYSDFGIRKKSRFIKEAEYTFDTIDMIARDPDSLFSDGGGVEDYLDALLKVSKKKREEFKRHDVFTDEVSQIGADEIPVRPRKIGDKGKTYKVGQLVTHKNFGSGKIAGIDTQGLYRVLKVEFDDGFATSILEQFADLLVRDENR